MTKKRSYKRITAIGVGAVMALSLGFGFGFSELPNSDTEDLNSVNTENTESVKGGGANSVANYAVSNNTLVDAIDGNHLPTYAAGSEYWYTDYAEGLKFSEKADGVQTDRIPVTVKTKKADGDTTDTTDYSAGTKYNPWVINSTDDWKVFVKYVATYSKNGAGRGEYFVLNRDLDYTNLEISSVAKFSGTFYGCGHTISNVKLKNSNTLQSQALGLFDYVSGDSVFFSDLVLKNISATENITAGHVGGLVGHSDANLTITSVTATGTFVLTNPTSASVGNPTGSLCQLSTYIHCGGIVGAAHYQGKTMSIYKCSADIKVTVNNGNKLYCGVGGIAGCFEGCSSTYDCKALNLYDCYSVVELNYNGVASSAQLWTGIVGFVRDTETVTMKRCFSVYNLTASATSENMAPGLLFTIGQAVHNVKNVYNIDACYGYGNFIQGSTKKGLPLVGLHHETPANLFDINDTIKNCKIYSDYDANGYYGTAAPMGGKAATVNNYPVDTLENFKTAAKEKLNNPTIWNSKVLDDIKAPTGGSTAITTPDITETPIVVSKTQITFKETDDSLLTLTGSDANPSTYDPVTASQNETALPTPVAPANKTFVGWSLDKTSDAVTHTTFPKNLYGNVTMYPVWDMTGVSVTESAVTAEDTNDSTVIVDSSTHTVNARYIGRTAVTLTASVESAPVASSDYTVTWSWYKQEDGGAPVLITDATGNTLELQELTDATYTAKAFIKHNTQLWRTASGVEATGYKVVISKGDLTPDGVITLYDKLTEGDKVTDVYAYWGQPLSELLPYVSVKMKNSFGITNIAGRVVWEDEHMKVGDTQNTYPATFIPTDQTNYSDTDIRVTISPTILQTVYSFDIGNGKTQTFAFNKEYGENVKGETIANEFENAYLDWLDSVEVSAPATYEAHVGKAPFISSLEINAYREKYTGEDRAFFTKEKVAQEGYLKKSKTYDETTNECKSTSVVLEIPVTLSDATKYAVTIKNVLNADKNGLKDDVKQYGYGTKVNKNLYPTDQTYTDSSDGKTRFLANWYKVGSDFTSFPADATDSRPYPVWGFDTDRVTNTLFIAADWMEGSLELISITAEVNGTKTFTARETPKSTDYKVTGKYTIKDPNSGAEKNTIYLVLSADDYTVTGEEGVSKYFIGNGSYQDGKNYRVTIKVKGSSSTISTTVDVKVNKKTVDLSELYFPFYPVEYDGSEKQIPEVSLDFLTEQGISNTDYSGVTYTYYNAGMKEIKDSSGNPVTGVTEVGTYYVRLTINWTSDDLQSETVLTTMEITEKAIEVIVEWDVEEGYVYTFNGQVQSPKATIRKANDNKVLSIKISYTGNADQTVVTDSASVTVVLENARYKFKEGADITRSFKIEKATIALPTLKQSEFEYKGEKYNIWDYIAIDGYTKEQFEHLINITGDDVRTDASIEYTATVSLKDDKNSQWEGSASATQKLKWTIYKKKLPVPTFTKTLTYNGLPYDIRDHLNNFDATLMYVQGGQNNAVKTLAESYKVIVALADFNNYEWQEPDFNGDIAWSIAKKELLLEWGPWNYIYSGKSVAPTAKVDVSSLAESDKNKSSLLNDPLDYRGDFPVVDPGSYQITAIIKNPSLSQNYVLHPATETLSFVIKASADEIILTVTWTVSPNSVFQFNGEVIHPEIASVKNENTGEMMSKEDVEGKYKVFYGGDYYGSKWNNNYTATVDIQSYTEGETLRVRNAKITYQIRGVGGDGNQPGTVNPGDTEKPGTNDGEGDTPDDSIIAVLPQILLSGVSLILIVVFGIMTANYASTAKTAKRKAQKLAQMNYSFAPAALLALGLSGGSWWVIAGVMMGLALLMAILMFVYRGKSKRALIMLEEEQERIEEEKEMARLDREAQLREEQIRRDNEMKMMFAAMQQGFQQPLQYGDMQNMINSAVSALLPGLQQMQALPPAPSDQNAYNAPQQPNYGMPNYGGQPNYGAPQNSEADELRAQLAEQKELINKLLQNQGQQPAAAPAPAYNAAYAEAAAADDAAWLDESDEVVSLEELYGNLSDDAKRCYYEIGSYIMSKPRTSQNDGKYAVLFRYSGKTLFKLCIKEDAPVLYYLAENGEKSELRIVDAAALETAKSIVDAQVRKTDGQ